jgi:hypothetical protein
LTALILDSDDKKPRGPISGFSNRMGLAGRFHVRPVKESLNVGVKAVCPPQLHAPTPI